FDVFNLCRGLVAVAQEISLFNMKYWHRLTVTIMGLYSCCDGYTTGVLSIITFMIKF
ncbi:hypothetical protein ACJX0J_024885, partial [Zea mays]